MKYNLVALFDNESYSTVESIQKDICKKYRLYKNNAPLYIPIGCINNPDLDKLDSVITKIISPYKKFKVIIDNSIGLNDTQSTVNLKIEDKGYIMRLSRNINDTLALHGFNVKDNDPFNFYISLANPNHAFKKSLSNQRTVINNNVSNEKFFKYIKVNRIELWKQGGSKKDMIVKSYQLKDY